jgi:mannosyltransferase
MTLSTSKTQRLAGWALLAIALLAAVWLRFNALTHLPLWLDEAYSVFGAEKSLDFIWRILPGYETHPPLYTTILHGWIALFGSSTFSVRLFGALTGCVSLFAIWMAARAMAGFAGKAAFWPCVCAVAIAGALQAFVDMSRLVRPYGLIILVNAIGILAVFRVAQGWRGDARLPIRPWIVYLIAQTLLFWLHNLGALYVASLGLALLILTGPVAMLKAHWRMFIIGHALVVLAVLPSFLILLDQAPTWVSDGWLRFVPGRVPEQLILLFGLPGAFGIACGAALALNSWRWPLLDRGRIIAALLVMALFPVIVSLLVSVAVAPVFLIRTLAGVCVPFALLLAAGAADGRVPRVIMILFVGLSIQRDIKVQSAPPDDDWYGAARWIAARIKPGDAIYAYPNEGALPFHYALRDIGQPLPIRSLPSDVPARDPAGWFPTGSRGVQSLPEWRLREIASDDQSRATRTIWLLRIQRGMYDKGDTALKVFSQGRTEVGQFNHGSIRMVGLTQNGEPE